MAVPFAAFLTVLRRIFASVTIIRQRIHSFVHFKDDVSSVSAVSSVRTAVWNVQLSAEAYMAVTAFAGTDIDLRSVCKHVSLSFPSGTDSV